ncbi:carboxypeptidase regulatory-like domain-containing protein [Variovorax sp. J22R133]|uniref:carboxypeptidase regulatory-like domain-containing protein n=1 Tax=Variovorax brevis TaxID=3053503 RepID=UPI00257584C5|nr:carboxypeptidase regulatory-like domain-containing protein [Variovorax sp. J22R133]MDM0111525.1 carboxypeptidase regulatory-like domain-containing protein [Variovorax sp. J22R133]
MRSLFYNPAFRGGVAACLSALAASAVWAQPEPAVTMPAEKVSPQIMPAEAPAVTSAATATARHKCGGIGSDESTAMRAQMKDHSLALLFARPGGEYLANVDVAIQGAQNAQSLNFRAGGPVCLIDLPAGTYNVRATSDGVSKSQSVIIGAGSKTVDFRF